MSALSAASNNRSTSKAACDYGCKNLVYRTNPATGTLHLQGGRIVREQDFADVAEQDVDSLFAVDFLVAVHRDHDGGVKLLAFV